MLRILIPDWKNPDVEEYHLFVSVPETLAYAVARNLRHRAREDQSVLNILDLFEDAEIDLKKGYHMFSLVEKFCIWLYTGQIAPHDEKLDSWYEPNYYDLWFFGDILESPLFQNSVIKALVALEELGVDKTWKTRTFKACQYKRNMSPESWSAQPEHFREREILLFVMDSLVWEGLKNNGVQDIIKDGGPLALELTKRFVDLEATKESQNGLPPWDAVNIGKYLVPEFTEVDRLYFEHLNPY